MNTLLAYKSGDGFYKVLTQTDDIYDSASLVFDHNCEFSEGADLDDDEWFKLSDFDQKDYFLPILGRNIASAEFSQLSENDYDKLGYLMAVQDNGNTYCFQKLTNQSILRRKLLQFSQMPVIRKLTKTILLESLPHAVYKKDEKCLFFKRLSTITSVIPGIEALYREATEEEANAFLSEPFLDSSGQIGVDKISSANLKRLHSASQKLSTLTLKKKERILEYIHKYNKNIPYDEISKKFTISNNTDLQYFLWGVEERYYSTITNRERRVARSILKLQR